MKANLIEGDFNICQVLDGYWLTPARVAEKLMRTEWDVTARMEKLFRRGILDRQESTVYRLSLARRLATYSKGVTKPHGERWVLVCKTPEEKAERKAKRDAVNKAKYELKKHMAREARALAKLSPPKPKAPAEPKPPQAPRKPKWFGIHPAAELHYGVQAHPKCFPDRVEYKAYLTSLKDSGEKTTSSGICMDCDRATMGRMGQMCEAPEGIKARMMA